jgi:cell division protein FtsI (penicillin-binding protein 3)
MDVHNGEVLALVSLPDFDPNHPGDIDGGASFNRTTQGVYEMGSTFKIFTAAMALESGTVDLDGGYDATEPIHIGRFTIRDYRPKRRWLTIPEILIYSSNIGAAKMASDVGIASQRAFMRKLGMLTSAAIELPEVGVPLVPSPWRKINTMTVAYGYGLAVSPIQLATGVATMVNGGIFYPATLLPRSPRASEETEEAKTNEHAPEAGEPGSRVISPETSKQIRRLMRLVVAKSTGKKAAVNGYLVGGKTGTAEKSAGGGYSKKALLSSFVSAFPMTAPRYVLFVMLDEPKGTKKTFGYAGGGWVAAPVVRRVIARIAPMLGIPPVNESSPEIQSEMMVNITPRGPSLASF